MKRLLVLFALISLACSGTTLVPTAPSPAAQPTLALIPTRVAPPPTHTPQPTAAPLPTTTPTPLPPPITAQNAGSVNQTSEMASNSLRKVVFAPGGGSIFATASGNDGDFGIKTWQSYGGSLLETYPGYSGIVWDLAFSPNGQWIASAADDHTGQRVRIWDVATSKQLLALDGPKTASSVAFSRDGTRLAVGGASNFPQGVIWIYDTTTWKRVQLMLAPGQNVLALAFSPDGSRLISSGTDGKIRLWSLPDGTELKTMFHGKEMNRLALSPDGSLLASAYCPLTASNGCSQGGVAIWRTSDWAIIQQFGDLAEGLAFSPDGSMLVSGSGPNDPLIRIRRVSDWSIVRTLAGKSISVAMSPDSRLLVSADINKITLWGVH